MTTYSKANTDVQWYQDNFPGATMNLTPETMVVCLHTTEGYDWPSYGGGTSAPNYTFKPGFGRAGAWRAHFPDEKSSRALRNLGGGVETNTLNVVQVELIGTCDPKHRVSWSGRRAGKDYVYWPEASTAQLREVAAFLADMHRRHGLKLKAPLFTAYPGSISNARFTFSEWRNFAGVCGHQHVPENSHGDPGNLNIPHILEMAREMVKPSKTGTTELHVAHFSLKVQNPLRQEQADIKRIFERAEERQYAWVTGTELFGMSESWLEARLNGVPEAHGYRFARPGRGDSWVAVRKDLVAGGWRTLWDTAVPKTKNNRELGAAAVEFDTRRLGHFTVMPNHLMRYGRPGAKDPAYRVNVEENRAVMRAVEKMANEQARGRSLVFYGGDQNINDRKDDTFMGAPLTSTWDELEKWENTGAGCIDVIASHDADTRVKATYTRVVTDAEEPLFTDHNGVEAGFLVQNLR